MEAIKGTKTKGMKIPHGHRVDCSKWLEFAITEHLRGADKVVYRVPDVDIVPNSGVESDPVHRAGLYSREA